MIKDKVREEDQIEVACCFRIGNRGIMISVWFGRGRSRGRGLVLGLGILQLQQSAPERINGSSPHIPQNAHDTGTAGGSLSMSLSAPARSRRRLVDVLVYVVG